MKNEKNIALVGFAGDYFYDFALSLQSVGFNVYWICTTNSMFLRLKRIQGLDEKYLCNPVINFNPDKIDIHNARKYLSKIEMEHYPTFNDIILMDRVLKKQNPDVAVKFIYHILVSIAFFLNRNSVDLINSGRDNAIQLSTMLLSKKLSIPWVVPTRMRIPKNMYGFCSNHETNSFLKISTPSKADYEWANYFLEKYLNEDIKPELKVSAMNFRDVLKLIPSHNRIFWRLLWDAFYDFNNTYTRYKISDIVSMYFKRRINMVKLYIYKPFKFPLPNKYFALYTLHTQPESSVDVSASFFSNQIEIIKQISRSLPMSHELYVKVHPTDVDGKNLSFYRAIKQIPSVKLIHFKCNTNSLIEEADLIFTLTGTVALEAGLRSKNVITFANNYFNILPTVNYCSDIKLLPNLIQKILRNNSIGVNREKIIYFLANMKASCFLGEFNRDYGANPSKLTKFDLESLANSYSMLYNLVKNNIEIE
jgi:hypothetical protein